MYNYDYFEKVQKRHSGDGRDKGNSNGKKRGRHPQELKAETALRDRFPVDRVKPIVCKAIWSRPTGATGAFSTRWMATAALT